MRKASLTALLAPELSTLLGLVADASAPLSSAPASSRVAEAPSGEGVGRGAALSGGGVGRSAAGALTAVNEDIITSVSED